MIALLVALLVAFGNGARDVRTPTFGAADDEGRTVVEFVAPQCPRWTDEPCYVVIGPDWSIDVGP